MTIRIEVPLFCLSLLVACSGGNSSSSQATDGGNDLAAEYAAFCADVSVATCNAFASCCNLSVDACEVADEAQCMKSGPHLSEAGQQFNSASAQACIAGIPSLITGCAVVPSSSPQYQATEQACRSVIVGTLPIGSDCSSGICASQPGSVVYCSSDPSGSSRCTAAPLLHQGDACDFTTQRDCASGLYCDINGTMGQCVPLKDVGATCSRPIECTSQICTNSTCVEQTLDSYCQTLKSN